MIISKGLVHIVIISKGTGFGVMNIQKAILVVIVLVYLSDSNMSLVQHFLANKQE